MMAEALKDDVAVGGDAMLNLQQAAARLVKDKIYHKHLSVKPSDYKYKNHSELFALASGSIRYHSVLKDILKKSGSLLLKEKIINKDIDLAVVLLYQYFVGTEFECAPYFNKIMKKHMTEIQAAYEMLLKENNARSLTDVLGGDCKQTKGIPWYARVNLIKCTVQEAIDRLCEDKWEYVGRLHLYRFKQDVSFLSECQFGVDPLLEDVLVFSCSTDVPNYQLVKDGVLVIQGRASCVAAHVLNPSPGSVVLDCCAAPGTKTNHLASLMKNQGQVIAMDNDPKKLKRMQPFLKKTGSSCVKAIAQNFLTLSRTSTEVSNITMILLDPPCRNKEHEEGFSCQQRNSYQTSLLYHALQFPNVQRVVYIAASNLEGEGEEVVQTVMYDFQHEFCFQTVLPEWPYSRGFETFLNYKSFLRVSPEEHLTEGSFIACFERIANPHVSVPRYITHKDSGFVCDCMDETIAELYQEAARILKFDPLEGATSSLVHSSNYKNLRQLFGLVSESMRYQSALKDITKRCGSKLLNEELINNNLELAVVVLYQHLVGEHFACAPRFVKMLTKHDSEIKAALLAFLKDKKAKSLADTLSQKSGDKKVSGTFALPHYARVNLTKCSLYEAIDRLCERGWECIGYLQVHRFKESVMSLSEQQFGLDPLLGDVLVFPFTTDMEALLVDDTLTQQDRASCVPVHVLNPEPGSVVLDCCAFPGNKSNHLASLMRNQGRVLAMDPDAERVSTMNSLFKKSGSTCIETIVQDFRILTPISEDMADVTMILLEPSNIFQEKCAQEDRRKYSSKYVKWHNISLLKHALRFPNVKRVVYFNRSNNPYLNEEVVEEVMCTVRAQFHFLQVVPDWPNSRGSGWFLNHQYFLRVSTRLHFAADNFFVACFQRKYSDRGIYHERVYKNSDLIVKSHEEKDNDRVFPKLADQTFAEKACDADGRIDNKSVNVEGKGKKRNKSGETARMAKKKIKKEKK